MSQNDALNDSFEYEENLSERTTPTKKRKIRGELSKGERPKHREQKYRPEWELKPSYKDWLRKVKGDNMKAKCIKCNTTFVSELVVIKNHALGKKHKINVSNTPKKSSTAMLNFIKDGNKKDPLEDKIKIAEIKLCALLVEHNIAFNCIDHIVGVLKDIFDDSEICQKIQLKRTKATNVIKNVISPFAKQILATKLKLSKFSVMIDESTDIGCESTMCIIVRFHDAEEQRIVSKFWSLIQVYDKKNIDKVNEGATANNLFSSCIQTFEEYKIPFTNIIGFGSDGCNSMFGVRNSVASRMQNVFPGIFLMKCICHSLHLVSSEACKELPKRCEDLARQIHSYFSQSSKRQSQFHQFQVFLNLKEHKILHPSATRWLSMSSVVNRIIEQWDALKLYFNDQWLSEKLLSSKTIYDQLNDPFTKAFYLFLEWVLPKFVLLNKYFQSDKIVLDVLHEKMILTPMIRQNI
ncbi:uncharacterized protein LOC112602039 [Melanaphis sacchari]|uniref:uncharacterized protein LOC112602039 n=1 Tax=Melanaphis sacchari TaxID=742174 RepID=UPI000DC15479|nr:uncharacterized protein LOC112602039 [Melanaphis sacchari]